MTLVFVSKSHPFATVLMTVKTYLMNETAVSDTSVYLKKILYCSNYFKHSGLFWSCLLQNTAVLQKSVFKNWSTFGDVTSNKMIFL